MVWTIMYFSMSLDIGLLVGGTQSDGSTRDWKDLDRRFRRADILQTRKDKKRTVVIAFGAGIVLLFVLGFWLWDSFFGQSIRRLEREHGLKIPASASDILCRGDAWELLDDRGAASAFVITTNDLPAFTSQLKVRSTLWKQEGIFPGNQEYQIHKPWMTGYPMTTYRCVSPKGKDLYVQIWRVGDFRVGVCLYTDWN
jgi:hypothetical protein